MDPKEFDRIFNKKINEALDNDAIDTIIIDQDRDAIGSERYCVRASWLDDTEDSGVGSTPAIAFRRYLKKLRESRSYVEK